MATNKAKLNKALADAMKKHGHDMGKSATAQLDAGKDFGNAVRNGKETNIGIEDARTYGDLFLAEREKVDGKPGTEKSAKSFASQLAGFARESVLVAATNSDPYAHLMAVKKANPKQLSGRSLFQMACSVNTAIEKHWKDNSNTAPTVDSDFTSAVFTNATPRSTAKEKTPEELLAAQLDEILKLAQAVLATKKGVKKDVRTALTSLKKVLA